MSSESWVSPQRAKTRAICSSDWTSHGSTNVEPIEVGQRPDALLDQALDRREADLGALGVERLGDAPGDRVVVGDAEDERRLAVEQSHPILRACRRRAAYHRRDDDRIGSATALRGVRGLVLDADGVLVLQGAAAAGRGRGGPRRSSERGIPFRVVTNFSQLHRETLAGWFAQGRPRDRPGPDHHRRPRRRPPTPRRPSRAGRCSCSPRRRAARVRRPAPADRRRGRRRCRPGPVAAVVIGDAGDDLSYRNMDVAFRLVRGGAELLAMHRNPWWLTPKGDDARRRRVRRRARVRDRAAGAGPRQAVAGRLPAGRRRAGAPTSASGCRARRSRWSATTRGPTSRRRSGSGCAAILVLSGKTRPADVERARPRGARRPRAGWHRRRRWPTSSPR